MPTTTTTVYYLTAWAFRVLLVDLFVLLGDCLICLLVLLAHQPLAWYLPATMGMLLALLIPLVLSARKIVIKIVIDRVDA